MKKGLIAGVLVFACVCGFASWRLYRFLTTPGSAPLHPVLVFVPEGTPLRVIAQRLASAGLIISARLFAWYTRLTGADRKIKSGEYVFTAPLSPLALLRILRDGEGLRHVVTVAEGMTFRQIAALLAARGLGAEESFLCLNVDPVFLAAWGLPPQGLEGYLYPDTYQFSWRASPEEILGRMVERFYAAISPAMYRQSATLDLSLHQVITLASLIEKETGAATERTLVATVFHNRLRQGIPLQCDPSVIYGIESFDGNLTRRHLLTPTLYNTYLFRGLPPGPIASPGLEAILAALNPAKLDYLYFVARGDGTHVFSSDLATHNRAVHSFQRGRS
ncbi:MAG: endolytic transglycosylase MltG [Deltaproteobacteria bacterium]|nr:endolytic transglycosylase MltG [Deltaproteobacteria bacterium]